MSLKQVKPLFGALAVALLFSITFAQQGSRGPALLEPASVESLDLGLQWIEDAGFEEAFDDITTLEASGWVLENRSDPVGITGWFQGNAGVFAAHEGAATAYIGANYQNASGSGATINTWAFLPEWSLRNGDEFSFYTRAVSNYFPDRLEVRVSTSGSSTETGPGPLDTGDFDTLLLSVNPDLANEYPTTAWEEQRFFLTGLSDSGTVSGRLAFRYFVTNAGLIGDNSDYIGIDSVSYFSYQPGISVTSAVGLTAACAAGNELELSAGDEYYLCYTLTNEGNVALTGAEWHDHAGASGNLDTLDTPLAALDVGASATWVTGPHTAAGGVGMPVQVQNLTTTWEATNDERGADAQAASSSVTLTVNAGKVLSVAPRTITGGEINPGGSADLVSFTLEAPGSDTVLISSFELTTDVDVSSGSPLSMQALLNTISVTVADVSIASSTTYAGANVAVVNLTTPLAIAAGESATITVRSSTANVIPQALAAGLMAFAGLGLALRSRRHQLLAAVVVLAVLLAACGGPGTKPNPRTVTFSVQLTGVTSDAVGAPADLPVTGPEFTVRY